MYRLLVLAFLLTPILSVSQNFTYVSDTSSIYWAGEGYQDCNVLQDSSGYIFLIRDFSLGYIAEKINLNGNFIWKKEIDADAYKPLSVSSTGFTTINSSAYLGPGSYGFGMRAYDGNGVKMLDVVDSTTFYYSTDKFIGFEDNSFAGWSTLNTDSVLFARYTNTGQKIWSTKILRPQGHYGITNSFSDSNGDILALDANLFLKKFDAITGQELWADSIIYNGWRQHGAIIELSDDNSYVYFIKSDSTNSKPLLRRLKNDGTLIWETNLNQELYLMGNDAITNGPNNTFYVAGTVGDWNDSEMYVAQLDNSGSVLWDSLFSDGDEYGKPFLASDDTGNFFLGSTIYTGNSSSPFALKLNTIQEIQEFENSVVQNDKFECFGVKEVGNGRFLQIGRGTPSTNSFIVHRYGNLNTMPNHVVGRLAKDADQDCSLTVSDKNLKNWLVKVEGNQNTYLTRTDEHGEFTFTTTREDSVLFSVQLPNGLWEHCQDSQKIVFPTVGTQFSLDFPVKALSDCADINTDISTSLLRRCFDNNLVVKVENQGTDPAVNTEVQVILDPFVNLVSSIPVPTSQNGQILTYAVPSLDISESRTFKLIVNVNCNALLGQEHCFVATPFANNTCQVPSPNTTLCMNNIGSYDPNDKTAFVNGHVVTDEIEVGDVLDYRIRFQNTGTDTAFTVVVVDTISANLNLNTLRLGASSHPYTFESENGVLRFTFNDIMLPDSNVNEPLSHGFFNYKIQQIAGLQPLDVIENFADIYFDFNDPVRTNTVSLMIPMPISTSEYVAPLPLRIFPNPSSGIVQIDLSEFPPSDYVLKVLDASGRFVLEKDILNVNTSLSVDLESGFYVFFLENEEGAKWSGKVRVER